MAAVGSAMYGLPKRIGSGGFFESAIGSSSMSELSSAAVVEYRLFSAFRLFYAAELVSIFAHHKNEEQHKPGSTFLLGRRGLIKMRTPIRLHDSQASSWLLLLSSFA